MRPTTLIADPTWQDILDRDKEIFRLTAKLAGMERALAILDKASQTFGGQEDQVDSTLLTPTAKAHKLLGILGGATQAMRFVALLRVDPYTDQMIANDLKLIARTVTRLREMVGPDLTPVYEIIREMS